MASAEVDHCERTELSRKDNVYFETFDSIFNAATYLPDAFTLI